MSELTHINCVALTARFPVGKPVVPAALMNRISEGLQLRVKDLDFDHGTIIVREGKGSKDRALMLPESLAPSLREQGN